MLGSTINGAMPSDLIASEDGMVADGKDKGPLKNPAFLALIAIIVAIAAYVGFKLINKK
jgi:hypothetical protein